MFKEGSMPDSMEYTAWEAWEAWMVLMDGGRRAGGGGSLQTQNPVGYDHLSNPGYHKASQSVSKRGRGLGQVVPLGVASDPCR